jgi:hypothetical protein
MINLYHNFSFTFRERQRLVYTIFGIKILSKGFQLTDKSTALAIRSIWEKILNEKILNEVGYEETVLLEEGH